MLSGQAPPRTLRSRPALRWACGLALWALAPLAVGSPAAAERLELSRYGGRLGLSISPDQFVLGGYADFGEITKNLSVRPSVDLGFGSSQFTLLGNGDVQYSFRNVDFPAVPYLGAGVALAWTKFQDVPAGADDSDGAVGLNLYAGVERGFGEYNSGHAEIRFGIDEIPDFKLMIGFGFY